MPPPAGQVLSQDPAKGEKVKEGSKVTLTVSGGVGTASIPPEIVGLTVADAQARLAAVGFNVVHDAGPGGRGRPRPRAGGQPGTGPLNTPIVLTVSIPQTSTTTLPPSTTVAPTTTLAPTTTMSPPTTTMSPPTTTTTSPPTTTTTSTPPATTTTV